MSLAYSSRYILYHPVVPTTTFVVPFPVFSLDGLVVHIDGANTTAFSVAATFDNGRSDDATVVLTAAVSGVDVEIYGVISPARSSDYLASSPNLAQNLQLDVDFLTAIVQEVVRDTIQAKASATAAQAAVDDMAAASAAATAAASQAAASAAAAQAAENSLLEWKGLWTTATAYGPSDLVQQGGNTYVAMISHTSGVFSTDLAAGRWQLFAAKGDSGAGSGDVVAANNGTEFNAGTFRANLELFKTQSSPLTAGSLDSLAEGKYKIGATPPTEGWPGIAIGDHVLCFVFDANAALQIGYRSGSTVIVYIRRKSSGTWGAWTAGPAAGGQNTIGIPASAFTPTSTNGAASALRELATNDVMVPGYDFDKDTDEHIQIMLPMPKGWDEGTLTAQVAWTDAATAGTGNVVWGVRMRAVGNDDALDAAFGTAQLVTDGFIASGDMHLSPTTAAITPAGSPAEGDWLVVDVYRDADSGSDTYSQDARLIGVKLVYSTNTWTDA